VTTDAAAARTSRDPLAAFAAEELATFGAIADRLIPAAHGMPSAADVVTAERLRFVLTSRPDLVEPLLVALRAQLADDPEARLELLARHEPVALGALQLAIVGGYYTDRQVRELIGYPGQQALTVRAWEYPEYLDEGLIDAVVARGPVWRDPATGRRATAADAPRTYAERWAASDGSPEGGNDGHART